MSVVAQPNMREISELVRSGKYQVDPGAVADAMVRRMVWDDVPDITPDPAGGAGRSTPPRLRGLVRVRRLMTGPFPPRPSLTG